MPGPLYQGLQQDPQQFSPTTQAAVNNMNEALNGKPQPQPQQPAKQGPTNMEALLSLYHALVNKPDKWNDRGPTSGY